EDNEAAHPGIAVLGGGSVDLLDELGDRLIQVAREDHGDRIVAVLTVQAVLLASAGAGQIQWMKGTGNLVTGLRARLQAFTGKHRPQHEGQTKKRECGDRELLHQPTSL